MGTSEREKRTPFEEQLIKLLSAIDNQIAREMQRTPSKTEIHGVQKWEPYQKRVELIVSSVLNGVGDEEVQLDSVLVFSQAMTKALLLLMEDLGEKGLGKMRAEYCHAAMEAIERDSSRALRLLRTDQDLQ